MPPKKLPDVKLMEMCKELVLTDENLKQIMKLYLQDIKLGLGKDTHATSIVKCFITYVQDLPTGKEKGKFLALDLGGTNFRVLVVTLNEKRFDMKSKIYAIPQSIMTGTGEQLFDHIAECLSNFCKEEKLLNERLPLGFTFSFPLMQKGLTKGILERWTKGFNCSGVVGKDVVELLEKAIKKRNDVKIDVTAVLNDTTGTLMSCAWKNRDCKIGLIIGTGTNACYVEKLENVELFDGDKSKPYVIINTETGAFGDDGKLDFIRTEYDKEVDKKSINPGRQLYEKMISGMYMGELVRLVLVKAINNKFIFDGKLSEKLGTQDSFQTSFVSVIESDKAGVANAKSTLKELGYPNPTDQDCLDLRFVCECISRRACHMVSATIATLINKLEVDSVTVGVDGSLYRFHPGFKNLMTVTIKQLIAPSITLQMMLSEDGSGRGAALVAAVAAKNK